MTLVRIVKDWDFPDLIRQTPGGSGLWEGIRYTLDAVDRCDYLIVLNNRMRSETRVRCPREHVWALMQEPYQPGFTDWMVEGHQPFSRIFTHCPLPNDRRYAVSHPAIPWHIDKTYDELVRLKVPEKARAVSWVVGNALDLPGHFKRMSFLQKLRKREDLPVDLFGRAVRPVADKFEALAPYRFSLAVENSSSPDYWTEKLADCFLTYTVPLYYGCTNIHHYFPEASIVAIDIRRPAEAFDIIERTLQQDEWEQRLPALREARRRVLERYQLMAHLGGLIRRYGDPAASEETVVVPPYRRSASTSVRRIGYKMRRRLRIGF